MRKEVKFNGQWHLVVGERKPIRLDRRCTLPPFLRLDNGMEVHPENPRIKIREVKENETRN